jgi:hypothetical protein
MYNLPNFIEIDIESLDEYYQAELMFKGHQVALDINFDEHSIEEQKLESIKKMIDELQAYSEVALTAIQLDYTEGKTAKKYIERHLKKLDPEADEKDLLRSKLYIKRIGFYPDDQDQFAIFDYTIGEELTSYLLVVIFKESGEVESIEMESRM